MSILFGISAGTRGKLDVNESKGFPAKKIGNGLLDEIGGQARNLKGLT